MLHVDKDLFAAAQAGDRAALERLLFQLRPDIQRDARFQCYASSSIEDVVQEALIVVYRRVGDVRSPAALGAWLVRVVARLCALPELTGSVGLVERGSRERAPQGTKESP